jgi:predicted transposase YbfD/YdcC
MLWVQEGMTTLAIVEAFKDLPDPRRKEGKRHQQTLCLALFTLGVSAGNQGFLAIGDWLKSYKTELIELFAPPKLRLPSYSTIRRVLLNVDYQAYSAIQLVSVYLVERGLILEPYEVDRKSNEIKTLPVVIKQLALKGVVFAFDAINSQKNCELIIDSGNHYLAALKGNQPKLFESVKEQFVREETVTSVNKGHGRIECRTVSICTNLDNIPKWVGLNTIIQVESQRTLIRDNYFVEQPIHTRYYLASFSDTASGFAARIRSYWGVENKVHYVRDVTQGEDKSRIRTSTLINTWVVARNFAINLYRSNFFDNMAQAQRQCAFGLVSNASLE